MSMALSICHISVIYVLLLNCGIEGDEFYIPFEEHLKIKKKREEDPDFDWDKELRALAVKYSLVDGVGPQ